MTKHIATGILLLALSVTALAQAKRPVARTRTGGGVSTAKAPAAVEATIKKLEAEWFAAVTSKGQEEEREA